MKNLKVPENWSGKEALAVHDFLADILEAIWKNYEDPMIEALQSEQNTLSDEMERSPTEEFNDEISF